MSDIEFINAALKGSVKKIKKTLPTNDKALMEAGLQLAIENKRKAAVEYLVEVCNVRVNDQSVICASKKNYQYLVKFLKRSQRKQQSR